MKLFPRGAWGYAVLLILLFSIAAIATKSVIDLAAERFYFPEQGRAMQEFSLAIWLLTMGLMFLAGALGLLAISATAEYESRHRISRIINRMNYLADGLLALDYQGRVRGANPAVRKAYFAGARPLAAKAELAPGHIALGKRDTLNSLFPSLTEEDTRRLLNRNSPCEIESEYFHSSGLRVLRLRSQPVEGLILVLVSDITEMHAANIRQQQTAKLQLLGRIAGGVAHDFSNILSAISGHAVLMQRFGDDKRSLNDSIGVIMNETQRGVRLSRQLLALSRSSDFDGQTSANLAENVREADELLRVALSAAWSVETTVQGIFPIVPLSPNKIVQIILNLGLLAADALQKPGRLLIQIKPPDNLNLPRASRGQPNDMISHDFCNFAAVITILASAEPPLKPGSAAASAAADGQTAAAQLQSGMIDTTGVIPSVVRALIEEAGGRLDELYASSTKSLYRIFFPFASEQSKSSLTPFKSVPARPGIKGRFRLRPWPSSPARNATHPPAAMQQFRAGSVAGGLAGPSPARAEAIRQWKILLASSDAAFARLEEMLAGLGAAVEKKSSIDEVLGVIDSEHKPDVIIADKRLFGDEANGLLKAVRKICPGAGIIIISRRPEEEKLRGEHGFVFLGTDSGEETWLDAIVSSRQLALPQK